MIRSVFYNEVRRLSSCGSCYPDPPEPYGEPVLDYKDFPSTAQEVVKVKTAAKTKFLLFMLNVPQCRHEQVLKMFFTLIESNQHNFMKKNHRLERSTCGFLIPSAHKKASGLGFLHCKSLISVGQDES